METSLKTFPTRAQLAEIGVKTLAGSYENDSFKFTFGPRLQHMKTCHVFAKHKNVVEILGPTFSENVDLSLYDSALHSGGEGAEFFISAKDKSEQWNLLTQALSAAPSFDRNFQRYSSGAKHSPSSYVENHARQAVRSAAKTIQDEISKNGDNKQVYNPVTDYGYLVTNLLVRDLVGLRMTKRHDFLYGVLQGPNSTLKQKSAHLKNSEIKRANELVFWIEVMFSHLFVNPGDHNETLLGASKIISKQYRKVIKSSIKDPIPGSLIDRMIKSRQKISISNARFEELVINIVMELVGSFQYLTGRGFAGIHKTIHTVFANTLGPNDKPLKSFNERLRKHPRAMIDEALRHNSPTGFIFRTAIKNFTYNGIEISSGDLLCMLCDQAVKDSSVFKDPETFYSPERAERHQNDYLAFASPDISPSSMRPHENHHPCFGQYWARTILSVMLEGLEHLQLSIDSNQNKITYS